MLRLSVEVIPVYHGGNLIDFEIITTLEASGHVIVENAQTSRISKVGHCGAYLI